jgi:hypothetical protein
MALRSVARITTGATQPTGVRMAQLPIKEMNRYKQMSSTSQRSAQISQAVVQRSCQMVSRSCRGVECSCCMLVFLSWSKSSYGEYRKHEDTNSSLELGIFGEERGKPDEHLQIWARAPLIAEIFLMQKVMAHPWAIVTRTPAWACINATDQNGTKGYY